MINEYQKPFSLQGRLNAEIITRVSYCGVPVITADGKCHCDHCEGERDDLKRRVNKMMGRDDFYEGV